MKGNRLDLTRTASKRLIKKRNCFKFWGVLNLLSLCRHTSIEGPTKKWVTGSYTEFRKTVLGTQMKMSEWLIKVQEMQLPLGVAQQR